MSEQEMQDLPPIQVITQYIKDMSFEVPGAPEIFALPPQESDLDTAIDISYEKMNNEHYEHLYEVSIVLELKALNQDKKELMILDLKYSGIFLLNVEPEQFEFILNIQCPNLLYPFVRETVATTTTKSGFAPIMLQPIDFAGLFFSKNPEKLEELRNMQ